MKAIEVTKVTDTSAIALVDKDIKKLQKLAVVTITDDKSFELAGSMLKSAKALKKQVNEVFDPMIKGAKDSLDLIKKEKAKHLDPIEAIEGDLRSATEDYYAAQEELKRAEQRRLDAIAAKAQAAANKWTETKIKRAAAKGIELDIEAPVIVAAKAEEVSKGGISFRETYGFLIMDESLIPKEFWIIDEKRLGEIARGTKATADIPGVSFYIDKVPVVR